MSPVSWPLHILYFIPCGIVTLLTLYNIMRSFRDADYTVHKYWKVSTMICYIIHSFSVILYLSILPCYSLNIKYGLNILSINTYTPFLISYNIWCIIIISMCLLQMVRSYMILKLSLHSMNGYNIINRMRYNYSIFGILIIIFISLWIMLYIWRSQYFVDYLVSWFIIIVYLYLTYLLYYKPIKICLFAAKTILKYNHQNQQKPKLFLDMLTFNECKYLCHGWIKQNISSLPSFSYYIPMDIKNLCIDFIFNPLETKTDKDIMVNFHEYELSLYLKKRIEANSRMIFIFIIISIIEIICVILYCLKIIIYDKNKLIAIICEIGIWICLLIEILCNNYIPARNKYCYSKMCIICKYYMDKLVINKTAPIAMRYHQYDHHNLEHNQNQYQLIMNQ